MGLILKGRIWKDGVFRAEIRELDIASKANSEEAALDILAQKVKDIAPDLEYSLEMHDGLIVLETDDSIAAAFLILRRNIKS